MAADAYATPADYRTRISPDRDAGSDAELGDDLIAVSRYMEGRLDRVFNKDLVAQSRVYVVGLSGDSIRIDDLSAAPLAGNVKVDANFDGTYETTLVAGTDYELLPLNAAAQAEVGPYTGIRYVPWSGKRFVAGTRVQITGLWGWPAVPHGVMVACIHLTAMLRLESPRASRRIPEGMDLAIETSLDAQRILRDLAAHYAAPWVVV